MISKYRQFSCLYGNCLQMNLGFLKNILMGGKESIFEGFFSGDGCASIDHKGELQIRIYSKCREGLEGLRQIFMHLGFHPNEIKEDRKLEYITYWFSILKEKYERFIDEIGGFKPKHKDLFFEEYKRSGGEEGERS